MCVYVCDRDLVMDPTAAAAHAAASQAFGEDLMAARSPAYRQVIQDFEE